jgi:hypothetical protein
LENETSEVDTLFSISLLHSGDELLKNSKAMQLMHSFSGAYFERGEWIDSREIHSCQSAFDSGKAINMIINRYSQRDRSVMGKKEDHMPDYVLDVYFGNAILNQITHYVKTCVIPSNLANCDSITLWPKVDPEDRDFFGTLISRALLFLKGYPILLDPSITDMSKYKIDRLVVLRRQDLFREIGIVQEVMAMLNLLQPVSDGVNYLRQSTNQKDSSNALLVLFMQESKFVLNQCLLLLFEMLRNNQKSQMYISDYLLVILAHVSMNKMAATIARELLSSNKELQETKIGIKEITVFAEKMREIQMNALYLELLQTCCSCLVRKGE